MGFWKFPSVTGGNINSINNAGLETFRDNPIDSLTREICQNSLDAIKNPEKPVVVEFKKFVSNGLPEKAQLHEAFIKGKETWKHGNEKSLRFINSAMSILSESNIECLRISDFNTVGLIGAEKAELGTPWSSLIKEAGSSNKRDDSGGSFGIGKAAPFLSSNLRTLFYSSFDKDGYLSHIGVADIMSFRKGDNSVTLGKGYFTNNENSNAISGLLKLDPYFNRKETGTDIFITAFNGMEDWKNEMIYSILKNFFLTVFQKKLVVIIDGFEVSHSNIAELIEGLEENNDNQILKNYFKLLTSDQTVKILYPAKKYKDGVEFEEGEAELLLLDGEDLNRRVLMTRKTGMRIFEQSNISGNISFTGLLYMKGKNMNKIFKQMENPAHNAWLSNRYEKNPKLGEKIFADLRKFIREKVKETYHQEVADTMNAIGLSDFLPNKYMLEGKNGEQVESIKSNVKSFEVKKINRESNNLSDSADMEKIFEQLKGDAGLSDGEYGGNGEGQKNGEGGTLPDNAATDLGGSNDIDSDSKGDIDMDNKTSPKSTPVQIIQKYACLSKETGEYKFMLIPHKKVEKGYIKFKLIGEQNTFDLPIKNVFFKDQDIRVDSFSKNTIYFTNPKMKESFDLQLQIEYSDYCVMEAGVYENS